MAVVVQCYHCNTVLELDEGFRGGVCRCSSCGTLLQVPRGESDSAAPTGRPARPAGPPVATAAARFGTPGTKTGSGRATAVPGESSGMLSQNRNAENADIIPLDAGPSSSGLRRIHQTQPVAPAPKKGTRKGSPPPGTLSAGGGKDLSAADLAAFFPPPPPPAADSGFMPIKLRKDQPNRMLWTAVIAFGVLFALLLAGVVIYSMRHL